MIVYLLSNGACDNIYSVDIRQPKINDLRGAKDLSKIPELKKTQFVRSLMVYPNMLDQLTLNDRDYLFALAAGVLSANRFDFSVNCQCENVIKSSIALDEMKLPFLEKGTKLECIKNIGGIDYTFRKLRVRDELDAIDLAIADEDDYEQRYADLLVASILGYPIEEASIGIVQNIDITAYYAAILFQESLSHSAQLIKVMQCDKCKKFMSTAINIDASMIDLDMGMIMDRFASISDKIDFKSFIEMELPEYNALIDSINNRIKQQNQNNKR